MFTMFGENLILKNQDCGCSISSVDIIWRVVITLLFYGHLQQQHDHQGIHDSPVMGKRLNVTITFIIIIFSVIIEHYYLQNDAKTYKKWLNKYTFVFYSNALSSV